MITLDLSKAKLAEDLGSYKEKVAEIHDMIRNKTGAGNDFLGWVELPENYDKEEVQLMKETAAKLREKVDVLSVVATILSRAPSLPYFFSHISLKILKEIEVSVVVPDLEITLIAKSLSSIYLAT